MKKHSRLRNAFLWAVLRQLMILALLLAALTVWGSAQTPQIPVFGMAGGTPTGGRAWDGRNPFVQPAATTNYWGSGDVDGDGVITANDALLAQQMAAHPATARITADVNGDGMVDGADANLISAAASGTPLPAWWNQLTTRAQRNAWLDKVMAIEPTKAYTDPVWWFACVQFSLQTQFHGSFYRNDLYGTYFGGGQTWFNVPMYSVDLGIGHAINAVLVGDNPLVMTDWRFIEPQGGYDVSAATDPNYFPSGEIVNIFVPDHVQVGGTSYMGGHAAVSFTMGANATYTVSGYDPNLVLTRPALPPNVVPDNRLDLWNPHILTVGNGMLLFERQRDDMTRADDIHITDLPFADPPAATPLVLDSQFTRLVDTATGPDQAIHLLWNGGGGYLPGLFHGILNAGTRALQSVTRVTTGSREIHGGRIVFTANGDMHAFWSVRKSSGYAAYTTGVYWSKWDGSAWSSEQNIAPSAYFSDVAGNWHDDDDARYFFDAVTDQNGDILVVWAAADNYGNLTLRSIRYNGFSWSAPTDIEAMGIAGGVSLVRDASGLVHLVYWRTGSNACCTSFGNLLHRTFDGNTWSSPDTVDGGGGSSTPRMVAAGNSMYLVWQRDTGLQRVPVWRQWANSVWSADHVLAVRNGADAYYPSAGVLPGGALAFAWSSRSADRVTIETAYANLNVTPAARPVFSPTPGTYTTPQSVTITDAAPGATIYYTTDGSTPTINSSVYNGPFTIASSQTLKAMAIASGYSASAVMAGSYTIKVLPALKPAFSPASGLYTTHISLTLSDATAGATIYYTTDGTVPTANSSVYSGPIPLSSSMIVKAMATAPGCSASVVSMAMYTLRLTPAARPTLSLASGSYKTTQTVTITDATPGATIYYTTNGTLPTTASAQYTQPLSVSSTQTISAIAAAPGYANSPLGAARYVITPSAATPTFSPVGGIYAIPQQVTISDATSGAVIYYSLSGGPSVRYTRPIAVSATQTISAYAVAAGHSQSTTGTAQYTIK